MNKTTTTQQAKTASFPPATKGSVLQRQCACGNHTSGGGECTECAKKKVGLQRKLSIGASNDPLEQEADRVADQVMEASLNSAVNVRPPSIQRYARQVAEGSDAALANEVPPIIHEVLRSPGHQLDPTTRAFFEPRFTHDFSMVRVHTDARAAESARAVNASAYTVGRDIVFDSGQLAPETNVGRKLLAHELTHVLQQGFVNHLAFLSITAPNESMELEAERNSQVVEHGLQVQVTEQTSTNPVLARRGTMPSPRPPPTLVRPAPRPTFRGVPGSPGNTSPESGPGERTMPAETDQTFDEMYERAKKAPNYEAAKDELERPVATLNRGGTAPDFVTVSPQSKSLAIAGGFAADRGNINVTYKPHWFHVLDAMEHDIAAINTSNQLIDIFRTYFPESVLKFGRTIAGSASYGANVSLRFGTEFEPKTLDPGGNARTVVFITSVTNKSKNNPKISTYDLMKTLIQEQDEHEKNMDEQRKKRLLAEDKDKECSTKEVDRKGGNRDHDDYAKSVTKADKDFQITAPDGKTQCTTDGLEPMIPKSVWEVKTRHEWLTSYGITGAIFAPYFSGRPTSEGTSEKSMGRIGDIEEQKTRCLEVTERCGYKYSYAFETEEAAKFMQKQWDNRPPVYHRKR